MVTKTNWISTDYLTYTDLNRIENNIIEARNLIATYDTTPLSSSNKTDWETKSIVFYENLNRIEQNIKYLIDRCLAIVTDSPKTTWISEEINYIDINRIEQNILDCYNTALRIIAEFEKCGYFTCGQTFSF